MGLDADLILSITQLSFITSIEPALKTFISSRVCMKSKERLSEVNGERQNLTLTEYRPLNKLIKMAQMSTSSTRQLCQISSKSVHGGLLGKCVTYDFFLIYIFNFYLSSVVSMIIADKKANNEK